MKYVSSLVFVVTLVIGLMSCAGSKASSSGDVGGGCVAPSKTYGNADVDNFLQTSYDICEKLQEANELLSEANDFLADPGLYIAKKGAQAKAELISNVTGMINDIPETVIQRALDTMKGSGDATSAAKDLPGMDKLKATKDVKGAIDNLKSAGDTAPKVVEELNSLLSKF